MGTTVHPDAERLAAYDQQVRRMVADPDMRSKTLAVGLALAWLIREHGPGKNVFNTHDIAAVAKLDRNGHHGTITITGLGTRRTTTWNHSRLKEAIADDAPVYRIGWLYLPHDAGRCEALMIRREGLCGNRPNTHVRELNWEDGAESVHWFCNRHKETARKPERTLRERDERLGAERGDPPRPAANHGGLLQRHFPRLAWDKIYKWASPGWEPPVSVPASYTAPPFELQLIDGDGEPEQVVGEPPALTVLHGMPDRLAGRRPRPPRGPKPA